MNVGKEQARLVATLPKVYGKAESWTETQNFTSMMDLKEMAEIRKFERAMHDLKVGSSSLYATHVIERRSEKNNFCDEDESDYDNQEIGLGKDTKSFRQRPKKGYLRRCFSSTSDNNRSISAPQFSCRDCEDELIAKAKFAACFVGASPSSFVAAKNVKGRVLFQPLKSAIKKPISHRLVVASAARQGSDMEKKIAFSSVEIREYFVTLGDNPGGSDGPPLTLDWHYDRESIIVVQVDDYENFRQPRRTRKELYMDARIRIFLLTEEAGFSVQEVQVAAGEAQRIRGQRKSLNTFAPAKFILTALKFTWKKMNLIQKKA